jgi:hypothetical protein
MDMIKEREFSDGNIEPTGTEFRGMIGIVAALTAVFATPHDVPAAKSEKVALAGKAILLEAALKPVGVKVDPDPIAKQVVLRASDGTITPLLCDEGSRALFLDGRLRDRQIVVQGRRYTGVPYLQVTSFQVEESGKLLTPEYYCEICTISVRYPQACPCCQGPMELRMRPADR